MASMDNGYTQVPNNIYGAMLSYNFTELQLLTVMYVVRQTYGYHITKAEISVRRMAIETSRDRGRLSRTVSDLEKMNVLSVERQGAWKASIIYVKDPSEWETPCGENTVAKKTQGAKTLQRKSDSASVAVSPHPSVAKKTHPPVADSLQNTVAVSPHNKERKKDIKDSIKENEKKENFSLPDDDDDEGEDPNEVLERIRAEKERMRNGAV